MDDENARKRRWEVMERKKRPIRRAKEDTAACVSESYMLLSKFLKAAGSRKTTSTTGKVQSCNRRRRSFCRQNEILTHIGILGPSRIPTRKTMMWTFR